MSTSPDDLRQYSASIEQERARAGIIEAIEPREGEPSLPNKPIEA